MTNKPSSYAGMKGQASRPPKGFTLVELMVVVALIGIISALLLPALARSKERAQAFRCLGNLRQLQTAWILYTDENNGWLPGVIGGSYPGAGRWVSGWMDLSSSSDNTNTLHLTDDQFSQLAPYIRTPGVYRCPSDRSAVMIEGRLRARVRSVSMNCWMNYVGSEEIGQDEYRVFRKVDDITLPRPANAWVLMDEREDSINDGLFKTDLKRRGAAARIGDFPASYHGRSAGITFADGHAEIKRWVDRRTTPPMRLRQLLDLDVPSPDNPDVAWLQERSSSARSAVE